MIPKTDWGAAFVAGLVCGEGNFAVVVAKNPSTRLGFHVRTVFQLEMAVADAPLVESLADFFGFGSICYPAPRTRVARESATCKYVATAIKDCLRLVDFFRENPLLGDKARSFEAWAECVGIVSNSDHTHSDGFKRVLEIRDRQDPSRRPNSFQPASEILSNLPYVPKGKTFDVWTEEEEEVIISYLKGEINHVQLENLTGRKGASLNNKVSRMRKKLVK